jgi:glutaminase
MTDLQALLDETHAAVAPQIGSGKVADYIPALARIDPQQFGMAVVGLDGQVARVGASDVPFSIQSISKVFTLTVALNLRGDELWRRVGREPSGSPFNSIVQLENEHGIPRNPFINAGAIAVSDVVLESGTASAAKDRILGFVKELAHDRSVYIDLEVAASERDTGFRNAALANFMKAFGNLEHPVDRVLEVYFSQCAIAMTCQQLARATLYLANAGRDPVDGEAIVSPQRARRITALMLTCGHYDASGDFAFRVGLPGKSGVGGGIVAVIPNVGTVAVWSPGLNEQGNSLVGTLALEHLAQSAGWSIFTA